MTSDAVTRLDLPKDNRLMHCTVHPLKESTCSWRAFTILTGSSTAWSMRVSGSFAWS